MQRKTCNFTLLDQQGIASEIEGHIKEKLPLSLIRLGDGEGVLLSLSKESTAYDRSYLAEHLGPDVSTQEWLSIKQRLIDAMQNVDLLGVRDDICNVEFESDFFELPEAEFLRHVKERFLLREVERNLPYKAARRIALLHRSLKSIDLGDDVQFCSSWCQYHLHNSRWIFKICQDQRKLGVVSSRPMIKVLLQQKFNIPVESYLVPGKYIDIAPDRRKDFSHSVYETLLRNIQVEYPGMLFLVGAGFYGKLICDSVKRQGGIALDMGSLLDAWCGIASRPIIYKWLYAATVQKGSFHDQLHLERVAIG